MIVKRPPGTEDLYEDDFELDPPHNYWRADCHGYVSPLDESVRSNKRQRRIGFRRRIKVRAECWRVDEKREK